MSNVDWRNAVPQTRSAKAGNGVMAAIAVGVATIIFAVCIVAYSNHSAKLARLDLEAQEARRLEQEREQREQQARRFAEQDEYERELRRKRLEREEDDLRLLAEKKKRKRGEAVQEADGGGNDATSAHSAALALFASSSARFSSELPKGVRKDVFFCIFASYRNDRLIYKVETRKGESMKVTAISPSAAPVAADALLFKNRMRKEPFAAAIDSGVWIYSIASPAGKTFPVPTRGTDFSLYDAVFGVEFGEALAVAGVQPPEKRFACSLRRTKGDGQVCNICEIGFYRALERTEIEAAVSKDLDRQFSRVIDDKRKEIVKTFEKKRKALGKPYRPKYVLYDGSIIAHDLNVTKVPRSFHFLGVRNQARAETIIEAERRWQNLYYRAVAEEKKADRLCAEYYNKLSAINEEEKLALSSLEYVSVSYDVIDKALSQRELFISGDIIR